MLFAAQVMTDAIMKYYSPVTMYEKQLGEFADGYVLRNAEDFEDVTGMEFTDLPVAMASQKYLEWKREALKIENLDNHLQGQIVPPVQQAPKENLIGRINKN